MFSEILSRKTGLRTFTRHMYTLNKFLVQIISSMGGVIGPPIDREIRQTGTKRYADSHDYSV